MNSFLLLSLKVFIFFTPTDIEQMQGEWKLIYRNRYGVIDTEPCTMKVVKNEFKINSTVGKVELYPPDQIDIINISSGRLMKGKYILSDKIQIIYFNENDNIRPKSLTDRNIRINIWMKQ